jgi:hypothetical protein
MVDRWCAPLLPRARQACGSGATTGGLALAVHLAGLGVRVHGYGVCDDEPYFYDFIDALIAGLGGAAAGVASRDIVRIVQAKGAGYAISTEAELQAVQVSHDPAVGAASAALATTTVSDVRHRTWRCCECTATHLPNAASTTPLTAMRVHQPAHVVTSPQFSFLAKFLPLPPPDCRHSTRRGSHFRTD